MIQFSCWNKTSSIVFGKTSETDDNSGLTTKLVTLLQGGGNESMFYGVNQALHQAPGTRPGDSNERLEVTILEEAEPS